MGRKKKEELTEPPAKGDESEEDKCSISVNGDPAVPFPSKEATEQVTEMVRGHLEKDGLLKAAEDGLDELRAMRRKNNQQLDLEGRPLPEPEVLEDESTETKTFALYFSNGLRFRMGEEALDKALDKKSTENVSDRNDRIKLMVQNRVKVLNPSKPLDPNKWDAGTRAIYERIMVGHGKEP